MTRTLAELPYKEKDEILDWTCIPAGSCDMNFRPASAHPTGDIREVVVLLVSFGPMPSHSFPEDVDGFSALSANWDAFCQYHFAPLL